MNNILHKIEVREVINCTWVLDGCSFICSHDKTEIVELTDDNFGIDGHYQTDYLRYACSECGEILEGDPDWDRQDLIAESQLMEILGK